MSSARLFRSKAAANRERMLARLERMTERDWDLTIPFDDGVVDAQLGEAMNRFMSRLRTEIANTARAALTVSSTAPHLAELASQTQRDSGQLSDSSSSIASAAEQMATTIERELSQNTSEIAEFSAGVTQAVTDCDGYGDAVQAHVLDVDQRVADLADEINALNEQAQRIGEIIGMIDGIAQQTNLLALNAAIEAARAGAHGRGFAVVADEVRGLAYQTADATKGVQGIVEQVQGSIGNAVAGVAEVREHVARSREQVGATRSRLKEAREGMDQLDERIRGISAATEEMGYAAQSVSRNVQETAGIAQGMADKAASVSTAGEQLHQLADTLLTAIGIFRLEGHRDARLAAEALAKDPGVAAMERRAAEAAMRSALNRNDGFELLYLTDAHGVQITDNIAPEGFTASYGNSGYGQDWSSREWFRHAAGDEETYVTPVYRSAATGQFCFTVAAPVRRRDGKLAGILGADIRLGAVL